MHDSFSHRPVRGWREPPAGASNVRKSSSPAPVKPGYLVHGLERQSRKAMVEEVYKLMQATRTRRGQRRG